MKIIDRIPQLNIVKQDLERGRCVQLEGCVLSQTEHMLSELAQDFAYTVLIARDEVNTSEILGSYAAYEKNVLLYPALDPLFHKADIQGSYLSEQRSRVIRRICEDIPCTIVTTLDAFHEELCPVSRVGEEVIVIRPGGYRRPAGTC